MKHALRRACLVLGTAACAAQGTPAASSRVTPPSAASPGLSRALSSPALAEEPGLEPEAAGAPWLPAPAATASPPPLRFDPTQSTSIGHPAEGKLEPGLELPLMGPGFRVNERRESKARYATAEVLGAITRAAAQVANAFPGSELIVNDLSLPRGGPIDHHGSHRAGRDADILFYLRGADGAFTPSVGAPIDPEGVGFDFQDLATAADDVRVLFDAPRTWRFVAALLEDPEARVQRIFIAEHLRSQLLAEAVRSGALAETRERFAEVTCQPSYPHDDHLHVRWFCSHEDLALGCSDLPPLYPWREAELQAAGLTPVLGALRRERPRSKIVTHADEDRAVAKQVLHPAVRAFLARRKHWREQPHPGRKYCP